MTREELEEIFESEDTNWEGDNTFQGLQILSKYVKHVVCAVGHEVLYSAGIDEVLEAGLTREDAEKLRELNWMLEEDCFACYV